MLASGAQSRQIHGMNMSELDTDIYDQAVADLSSPQASTKEAAERTLLRAHNEGSAALVRGLEKSAEEIPMPLKAKLALMLGAMKARDALPALFRLCADAFTPLELKPYLARAAAEIVDGRDAFDEDVRVFLEEWSTSSEPLLRAAAGQAFAGLGDLRSKSRLEALAGDENPWVREQAETGLRQVVQAEQETEAPTWNDFAAMAKAAADEGGKLKPWLDDLGDPRRAVRDAAATQLVEAGKEAIPFLIDKLNQPEALPRIGAAQALGRLQAVEAAGPLLIAATAPTQTHVEEELVPVALRALANSLTGTEEGLGATLLPLAKHDDRFVRAAALLCLGRIPDRDAIRAVVDALADADAYVVESAAIALSEGVREEDFELVAPLLRVLAHAEGNASAALREAILIALSRITVSEAAWQIRIRHFVRHEISGPTASTRKAAIALLDRLYHADDPPPLTVVDDVIVRLRDEHPEVRVVAAAFLGQHLMPGFTEAVRFLCEAIDREERTLTLLCMDALRRHDTPTAKAALEALTADDDASIRNRAEELLLDFSPGHEEWRFESKARPMDDVPPLAESQKPRYASATRPKRVRPVDTRQAAPLEEAPPAQNGSETSDIVEAKFDDPPAPANNSDDRETSEPSA